MFRLGQNSLNNRAGVDPRLIEITDLAIQLSNIDFGIPSTGGLRTIEDQIALFTAGKSKCDGRTNKSYHQTGLAIDLYAYVDGKASWDHLHLTHIATSMLQASAVLGHKLKWGGLWDSWQDMPHFELES